MPRTPAKATKALKQPERKQVVALTNAVLAFIAQMDAVMKTPGSAERGRKIAELINALEVENDKARYFALGVDLRTDQKKPLKR